MVGIRGYTSAYTDHLEGLAAHTSSRIRSVHLALPASPGPKTEVLPERPSTPKRAVDLEIVATRIHSRLDLPARADPKAISPRLRLLAIGRGPDLTTAWVPRSRVCPSSAHG